MGSLGVVVLGGRLSGIENGFKHQYQEHDEEKQDFHDVLLHARCHKAGVCFMIKIGELPCVVRQGKTDF